MEDYISLREFKNLNPDNPYNSDNGDSFIKMLLTVPMVFNL